MKRIAIIGAGPSGLVAAKECLEAGMIPTIFESCSDLGGVWHPDHGKTWRGMDSLLSKFHICFSDFPFFSADDFPTNTEVFRYLHDYAAAFSVTPHIRYEQKITGVNYDGRDWHVTHQQGTENYDGVIMASGVFAENALPAFPDLDKFHGKILHSGDYKNARDFQNHHVAVIGGSYSGYEIAADLAQYDIQVSHVFRQPSWMAKRYIDDAPYDLTSYRHRAPEDAKTAQENWMKKQAYFNNVIGNPGEFHPALQMDASNPAPANIVIAEDYLPHVAKKNITPYRDAIARFDSAQIHLASGQNLHADTVIFCTGYESNAPLHPHIADLLNYNKNDLFQPLILNKNTLHPDFPSLAFVGLYRGPYFGVMEMQARWTAATLSGQIAPPSKKRHQQELQKETAFRQMTAPRPAFQRGNYPAFMHELAAEIGVAPPDLINSDQPMLPADFRLHGIGAKPVLALRERNRLQERLGL